MGGKAGPRKDRPIRHVGPGQQFVVVQTEHVNGSWEVAGDDRYRSTRVANGEPVLQAIKDKVREDTIRNTRQKSH